MMQCPKCGNDMEERTGFFGNFYSCKFCGATADPPNTLSFDERFQKAVENYCRICGEYRRLVDNSISINMNPERGLSLLRDYEKKFSSDANDYLRPMDKTLRKSAFLGAKKVMNSETALVFARFANACVQLNKFQEAKHYIDHALELADPIDESYQEIFVTQSEINAHLSALETSTTSENLPLLTNKLTTEPTKAVNSSVPPKSEKESSFAPESNNVDDSSSALSELQKHEDATKAPICSREGLFSTYGRRSRLPYLCIGLLFSFLSFAILPLIQHSVFIFFLLYILSFFVSMSNCFKRIHDLDKPNIVAKIYIAILLLNTILSILLLLLHDLNLFYMVILFSLLTLVFSLYLIFAPGTKGTNRYGRSPEELSVSEKEHNHSNAP